MLERDKKAKVGVTVESQYDPTRIKRKEVVLKQLLAEHGHQFATVRTEVKTIPPARVAVTFIVKEGPTVKVGKIGFEGNNRINSRTLRAAMKNSKPIGIPHSIILENLFARTFDATKLDEDVERVRAAYRDRGYFKVQPGDPITKVRDSGGFNIFTLHPSNGKRIDIEIPIEEGARYKLAAIKFTGYDKNVVSPAALRAQFALKDGEYFNATLFGKGLEALRKAYGSLGYINMVANPTPSFDEAKQTITLNIDIDPGKQFFVSRIEFSGNTITPRPRHPPRTAARRGSAVQQPGLGELHPAAEPAELLRYVEGGPGLRDPHQQRRRHGRPTAEAEGKGQELHRPERRTVRVCPARSSALNYETNNFLGLGETLSVVANIGNLSRNLTFGFTEPYLRNKPISLGFQVFAQQVRLQPCQELRRGRRGQYQPVERAAIAADELQPVQHGPDAVGQHAAAPPVPSQCRCHARGYLLRAHAVEHLHLQRQHPQRV